MFSRELGTKLTGRHIDIELFPFSFVEYLNFKEYRASPDDIFSTEQRTVLEKFFNAYLMEGGFPGYLKYQDRAILEGIYEDILFRDIFQRHKINDIRLFRELALYLMSNVTSAISYTKLKDYFQLGSTNTVINYISYLEECYLIFVVNAFSPAYKKQVNSPKKFMLFQMLLLIN